MPLRNRRPAKAPPAATPQPSQLFSSAAQPSHQAGAWDLLFAGAAVLNLPSSPDYDSSKPTVFQVGKDGKMKARIACYVDDWMCAAGSCAECRKVVDVLSKHVGEATVFVSWHLGTPLETLHDALGQFIARHRLDPARTFFWVCDYVIRQTDVTGDLDYLGDCVAAIGHTALSLNPWDKPTALGRSYCLTEVAATQSSGAKLDVLMSVSQQEEFVKALGRREGLAPILAAWTR